MIAVCSGQYHLSKRMIKGMMGDFFDADLALGSVSKLEADTSAALAAPVALAAAHVRAQPVRHADETGWTEATVGRGPPGRSDFRSVECLQIMTPLSGEIPLLLRQGSRFVERISGRW